MSLSIPDKKDWSFDGGEFTMCSCDYTDKDGNYQMEHCSCKNWKECKGFKNGNFKI